MRRARLAVPARRSDQEVEAIPSACPAGVSEGAGEGSVGGLGGREKLKVLKVKYEAIAVYGFGSSIPFWRRPTPSQKGRVVPVRDCGIQVGFGPPKASLGEVTWLPS